MYTKKFSPPRYESIKEILEKIQDLEEGKSFQIYGLTPKKMHKIRWLLYDWLQHVGFKHLFSIQLVSNELRITKRPAKELRFLLKDKD